MIFTITDIEGVVVITPGSPTAPSISSVLIPRSVTEYVPGSGSTVLSLQGLVRLGGALASLPPLTREARNS